MPKYNPSDEEMDMYGSSPVAPSGESETAPEKESVDEENQEADTAVISNKILSPDGEPINKGDEIVLQVVQNFGDESEVKYAPKKEGGEEEETDEEPMSDTAADMAALSNEREY